MGHRCILSCLVAVDMYRVVGLPSFVLFVCLFVFSPLFAISTVRSAAVILQSPTKKMEVVG